MTKNLLDKTKDRSPLKREVVTPVDAFEVSPEKKTVVKKELTDKTDTIKKEERIKKTYRFYVNKIEDLEALAYERRTTVTDLLDRIVDTFIKENENDIKKAKELKERLKNA